MRCLKSILPLLLLLTLPACAGPAAMLASAALGSLGGAAANSSSGMDPAGDSYNYRSANTASDAQNGHRVDRSITQALEVSDQEVTSACRKHLPENADEQLAAGECEVRMTCLPGAKVPMQLRVCMPPDDGTNVSAQSDSVSRPVGQTL